MFTITVAVVEQAALSWFADLGWQAAHRPDIALDTSGAERDNLGEVELESRRRLAWLLEAPKQTGRIEQ